MIAVESARMLPTLRSIPPVRMTKVMASEMNADQGDLAQDVGKIAGLEEDARTIGGRRADDDGEQQNAEQCGQAPCAAQHFGVERQQGASDEGPAFVAADRIISCVASLAS